MRRVLPVTEGLAGMGAECSSVAVRPRDLSEAATSWREVFAFRGLAPTDCEALVHAAEARAAERGGWATDRHGKYKTTDMNMAELGDEAQRIAAPLMAVLEQFAARHYGVGLPPTDAGASPEFTFHDLFVVKVRRRRCSCVPRGAGAGA